MSENKKRKARVVLSEQDCRKIVWMYANGVTVEKLKTLVM